MRKEEARLRSDPDPIKRAAAERKEKGLSVFGQLVELGGIEGQSVKFPAAVKKGGFLIHRGVTLGDVTSGSFMAPRNEKFSSRIQWDSSTGLFSLSGLRLEDSGEYKVENTDQNISTVFQLNLYKDYVPVSKPIIKFTSNKYPCYLHCTMDRGTGVNMSWYREDGAAGILQTEGSKMWGLCLVLIVMLYSHVV